MGYKTQSSKYDKVMATTNSQQQCMLALGPQKTDPPNNQI